MRINISVEHPTFLLKEKVQGACQDFLNRFGFNYFQYLRCYADGSVGLLANDTSLFEFALSTDTMPVAFSSFKEQHHGSHSYWFLWDEELPEEPVRLVREIFRKHNGLTLVRRSQNYYDMIAVSSAAELSNAGSFYLNKMKVIEQLIHGFDKHNKDLIDVMDENPIAVPEHRRDANYEKICLPQGRFVVQGKDGSTHLTSQDLACLRLIAMSYSYKQVAIALGISPRSVETYVNRIKVRTGFSSRKEIEQLLTMCT
jgi:DNA-binding CsgD family transcriptional regulator